MAEHDRPLRIAHLAFSALPRTVGGLEIVVDSLIRNQMEAGHDVRLVTRWRQYRALRDAGFPYPALPLPPYQRLDSRPFRSVGPRWPVAAAVRWHQWRHRFDLWHIHWLYPTGWMAHDALVRAGAPVVMTAHGADLQVEPQVQMWAEKFATRHHALFLGRGVHYPIALEGALKLKEISYIHAEAYPAGELKHGPLALVTEDMPVVTVAPNDALLEKVKSNMQEVRARGGELYVLADADTRIAAQEGMHVIRLPEHYGLLSPILHVVPLQLLAYHAALARGTDVDKPRNLEKSVTVE